MQESNLIRTLYKRSKTKKIQVWSIYQDKDRYCTEEGFIDGLKTTSLWTECVGTNIGRSNERSAEQQCTFEISSKIKKRIEEGYVESLDLVDDHTKKISPMLAFEFSDYLKNLTDKALASQPKLDGMRCIATKNGLFTRNGKRIIAVPHIEQETQVLLSGLSDDIYLDGELYVHALNQDFNEIISICRKTKLTDDDLKKARVIEYHIYDIDMKDVFFNDRHSFLVQLLEDGYQYLKLVDTIFYGKGILKESSSDIDIIYAEYLEKGYEGQMIRLAESFYENNRSKNLLKRKEFKSEEFIIADILEGDGNRSGMMGRIALFNTDGSIFHSNARGTHDFFKQLLFEKENYIGKKATVRYQNLTPDGIPRFPVVIVIDPIDR